MARSLCYYCMWGELIDAKIELYVCFKRSGSGFFMRPGDKCPFFQKRGEMVGEEYGYGYDYFDDERVIHEAMEYCNDECFNQDIGCFEKCFRRQLEGEGDYG